MNFLFDEDIVHPACGRIGVGGGAGVERNVVRGRGVGAKYKLDAGVDIPIVVCYYTG